MSICKFSVSHTCPQHGVRKQPAGLRCCTCLPICVFYLEVAVNDVLFQIQCLGYSCSMCSMQSHLLGACTQTILLPISPEEMLQGNPFHFVLGVLLGCSH